MPRIDLVEQHASELAFLWMLRSAASLEPHYDLADLHALEERVDAHVDGLRIAGDLAWKVCKAALEEPGEVFAATVVAADRRDPAGIALVLDMLGDAPALHRAVCAGLSWSEPDVLAGLLPGLLDPECPAALRHLGIGACALQRLDPGIALMDALTDPDDALRARALRACGELGRTPMLRAARTELSSAHEGCRFGVAWSLGLAGDDDALPVLWNLVQGGGERAFPALAVAIRRADPRTAEGWIASLGGTRLGVMAAGMRGDPRSVPGLLQAMESAGLARVAGEAFSLITGVDLAQEKVSGATGRAVSLRAAGAPEGFVSGPNDDPEDDDVAPDPDASLPWPDVEAVSLWWSKNRGRFHAGTRHLLGKPITLPWTGEVLKSGFQRQRAAAAVERALLQPGYALFPVRGRVARQMALLG